MKSLTHKKEKFAQLVVELGNQSEAYRQSYNCSKMSEKTIWNKSSELMKVKEVTARVQEIKKELAEENKMTKQKVINYHLKMVSAWEELWELGKKKGKDKEETQRFYLLKEMVKGSDYRGSLDSVSKMLGLNESDKIEQTVRTIEIIEKKRE